MSALASGLYVLASPIAGEPPSAFPAGGGSLLHGLASHEELRLDVDGPCAQQVLSGSFVFGFAQRVDWLASLAPAGPERWAGSVVQRFGEPWRFPYATVAVHLLAPDANGRRALEVEYRGQGSLPRTAAYELVSPALRRFELEIDEVEGARGFLSLRTHDHPDRPSDLEDEELAIDEVFRRSGIEVTRSAGSGTVPLSLANENGTWDDAELHDAMQSYWSRHADRPQWSLWVLFAARHDQGRSLGGLMFDAIGPSQRRGVAIFTDSNIARPPGSETAGEAWTRRMCFFTLVHEMGHAFNLAHSWQKSQGRQWIPCANEPAARSFMNYPDKVAGGPRAFFGDFRYRFSDAELLFLRHAPERWVQMGNAAWFDDHGFRLAPRAEEPRLALELRTRPERKSFDYLEPIVLELKLSNVSARPVNVPADALAGGEALTVIVTRRGTSAREWSPFARGCHSGPPSELAPGAALYDSLFVSAGRNGWDIADPGVYSVQAALELDGECVVSNALEVRVVPPPSRAQEVLAQDYFSDEVGRVLAMDGSLYLAGANETLKDLKSRFPKTHAAFHARVALARPATLDFKRLDVDERSQTRRVNVVEARSDAGRRGMDAALIADASNALETLGHIDYNCYVQRYCDRLEAQGDAEGARTRLETLLAALHDSRSPERRPVSRAVLESIASRIGSLPSAEGRKVARRRKASKRRSAKR